VSQRLAIFAATSGHSGVDRVIRNLTQQLDAWDLPVDLLRIQNHGPRLDADRLRHGRVIDLHRAHVNSSLGPLVRYLRQVRPAALLTDKDRVNRLAILAVALSGAPTRLVVRLGTTVSVNLASRRTFERWQQRLSMRYLYPFAERVIVPSQGVAEDLAAYTGLSRGHIRVVPNPVVTPELDTLAAAPVSHPWLDGGPPVILGVGELGHRKGFDILVAAFAKVRKHRPCRLLILGRGGHRNRLLAQAESLGVREDVDLPGFTSNPYPYMARASLFVLSSRWEGFGVVLIEALYLGLPVVSTDCPHGPREILEDGRHGTLVPVGDADAMARGIEAALAVDSNPERSRSRALDFSSERSARGYLDVLGLNMEAASISKGSGYS
jgi:glycosyltransferase involved in cell wall biosynthesis